MPGNKHIIICSDGTGNQSNKGRGTNVFKIFEAVDNSGHHLDDGLVRQIAFYDDGVGTSKFAPIRMIGGALGLGVARNVRQLYRQICRCYKPGDKIFIFGFSRGAYTVRTLASIVIECGIVDMDSGKKIPYLPLLKPGSNLWLKWISWRAWRAHRRQFKSMLDYLFELILKGTPAQATESLRQMYSVDRNMNNRVRVHFLGVWDTVGAVGLPFDFLTWFINTFIYRFSFPNQELNLRVEKACQALAIDEERASFKPILWRESDDDTLDDLAGFRKRVTQLWNRILRKNRNTGSTTNYNIAEPCACEFASSNEAPPVRQRDSSEKTEARIEQVWFPGVHSDIGGGYPKQGLSYVALDWMMEKAGSCDLRYSRAAREMIREQRNVFDKLHDSRAGLGTVYRYKPRNLISLCEVSKARQRIHGATFERILDERNYRPTLVSCEAEVVKTPYEKVRDINASQSCVKNAKVAGNLKWWIDARIGLHWIFMAVLLWVVYLAQQHTGGWGELGKGLLGTWNSPIEALKTFILAPLKVNEWYWGKRVASALLIIAALSYFVQYKISSIQSTFWNSIFAKNGSA